MTKEDDKQIDSIYDFLSSPLRYTIKSNKCDYGSSPEPVK